MKKLLYVLLLGCLAAAACTEKHEDPQIPEDAYPTILGRWPSGNPAAYSVAMGGTLEIELQFAPSATCTGIWYLDDAEYCRGPRFSFTPTATGKYKLFLEVTSGNYTTSRTAEITVSNE